MSDLYEMRRVANAAKQTVRNAEEVSSQMVGFIVDNGRLEACSVYHLQKLKKKLKDFNAHTGKWKNEL